MGSKVAIDFAIIAFANSKDLNFSEPVACGFDEVIQNSVLALGDPIARLDPFEGTRVLRHGIDGEGEDFLDNLLVSREAELNGRSF
jgi:hypothetical protein